MTEFLDFGTFERSPRPNDYLVAPDGLTKAVPDQPAPVFAVPADALFDSVCKMLDQDGSFQEVAADPAGYRIKAVAVTPLLRFKDDVNVWITATDTGSTLSIYSRSRIGGGDLGANRRRVKKLLSQLNDRMGG